MIAFVSLLSFVFWVYLIGFHGLFWRSTPVLAHRAPSGKAKVAVIVPARDEAESIRQCLESLLAQDYPGELSIILVDDNSTDGTGDIAASCGADEQLTILTGEPLPPGWSGKLWAVHQGLAHEKAKTADYVLLTDADIVHARDHISALVAKAEVERLELVSEMVRLNCETIVERALIPAFIFFFQMLYPFARVNDPKSRIAAAAGGVMLVRPEPLARAGGLAAIRKALIDDCALGALMKTQGPIWLGLTDSVHSLRPYPGFGDIERMVTRSAYAQLDYSPLRLVGAILGMIVVYLAPPLLALFAETPAREAALVAYLLMIQSYMPSLRFYGLSRSRALALPLVAACYTWFTVESALQHMRGKGGAWKGRYQAH